MIPEAIQIQSKLTNSIEDGMEIASFKWSGIIVSDKTTTTRVMAN
jgi:hypothetical protein